MLKQVSQTIGKLIKAPFLVLVKAYRLIISPWLTPRCRFYPCCSCYAEQALQQHHLFKALPMIIWRILKCQPFHSGGYDPVPTTKEARLSDGL